VPRFHAHRATIGQAPWARKTIGCVTAHGWHLFNEDEIDFTNVKSTASNQATLRVSERLPASDML
jgi:hypothetical protein